METKIPIKSRISAIMEAYNRAAPAVLITPRGQSPEGLIPMPPHDNADDCIRVPLHSTKYPGLYALIDLEDVELVSRYRLSPTLCDGKLYVRACANGQKFYLHRIITSAQKGEEIDHIDGNRLDNRRSNLRFCTRRQNNQNKINPISRRTGYRGVDLVQGKYWAARIMTNRKYRHLGMHKSACDAALAYDAAARELFGEFACLNFPRPGERSAITGEIEAQS